MSMSLTWNGPAVAEKMQRAQLAGVNRTMSASVVHAKRNHPWKNRTGLLEGGINIVNYASPIVTGVQGSWGVQDFVQALILEVGGVITAKNAQALAIPLPGGGVVFRKSVVIPAYPYLRPAADATYVTLAENIRRAYAKDGGAAADVGGPDV